MKAKEERANAYANDVATTEERGWMDRSDIYVIARDAYLAGAIEQKAIDDAAKENLQIEWSAMYDRLHKEKEGLIDRACIAFKHFMLVQYGELIDESMEMYWKESITKAMEE